MCMFNWRNRVYALLLLCAATAIASPAQTLKTLYSFCKQSGCTDGRNPNCLTIRRAGGGIFDPARYPDHSQ